MCWLLSINLWNCVFNPFIFEIMCHPPTTEAKWSIMSLQNLSWCWSTFAFFYNLNISFSDQFTFNVCKNDFLYSAGSQMVNDLAVLFLEAQTGFWARLNSSCHRVVKWYLYNFQFTTNHQSVVYQLLNNKAKHHFWFSLCAHSGFFFETPRRIKTGEILDKGWGVCVCGRMALLKLNVR